MRGGMQVFVEVCLNFMFLILLRQIFTLSFGQTSGHCMPLCKKKCKKRYYYCYYYHYCYNKFSLLLGVQKKQPAGNRAKKCMHGKRKSRYNYYYYCYYYCYCYYYSLWFWLWLYFADARLASISLKKSTCTCMDTSPGIRCVCVCALNFKLDYLISVSDGQQRRLEETTAPAISSGAEARRRATTRLLPCKLHAPGQGTRYVPQARQEYCSKGALSACCCCSCCCQGVCDSDLC